MLKNDDIFQKVKFGIFVFGLMLLLLVSFITDFFYAMEWQNEN